MTGGVNDAALMLAGLPESDAADVMARLWRLMEKQTMRYTGGDSSSVPVETAREIIASVCYTIGLYLRESGKQRDILPGADMDEILRSGQKLLEEKLEQGRRLYNAACIGAVSMGSISYRDTLRSIGLFFKRYDHRLFARDVPCDIDYQLCRTVPEELCGIEYICEYLRRVVIENDFLRRFDEDALSRALSRSCRDYRVLLMNLYETVAADAVGLAISGGAVRALDVMDADRARIAALLDMRGDGAARSILKDSALSVCETLNIRDEPAREYLERTASDLWPRIQAALPHGGLSGIFA